MRESDLLSHIYAANDSLPTTTLIPPGDDMAMIETASGRILVAVDQLVQGRHVRLESTPLALVGRQALTRSLSDVAAMAARPLASLCAATLPPEFGAERAEALFDAMRETAHAYKCPLIGGDIAFHADASHPMVCSTTVFAEPATRAPVTRSGARAGDGLYVTGRLGGSLQPDGQGRHLTFEPRIDEALELSEVLGERLHAMIDISDGLGRDAGRIARMSGVAVIVDVERIPCSAGLEWREAVSQGEDYELCFAAAGDVPDQVGAIPITRVGEVTPCNGDDAPGVEFIDGTERVRGDDMGWEHANTD